MRILPRLLYLAAFIGLAASAALALDRALEPSMSGDLLRAVVMGGVLGAAGLVHRKAWGVSLVLLPLGAYVLFRMVLPPGAPVQGISALYHFYLDAFFTGAGQYAAKFFPLGLAGAPELRLLLVTVVYCLAGAASFLALSLRRPVPGVALVLPLLGFSFTVDTLPRLLLPAIVFLVLAACLLVLVRSLERRSWRLRDAVPGVLVGGAGAALALLLLGAAPSAAAPPWQDWRTWNPFNQGSQMFSFNWLQNYPRLLNPANNTVIMKVESPRPSYWRANALDEFTGEAWVSSQSFAHNLERERKTAGYVYSVPAAAPSPTGRAVTERFEVRSVYTNYFFIGGEPRSLTLNQDLLVGLNDMRSLHVVDALGPALDYTVEAVIPKVTPASLVGLGRHYEEGMRPYLQLPFPAAAQMETSEAPGDKEAAWREAAARDRSAGGQWADLYALNRTIIGEAADPYEITLRLERYLRQNYRYTLEPPPDDYSSPYAAFLFHTKAGYCQHFAGAMALLLRFNGIPARVAVGFTSGDLKSAGVYSVATNNAHAWVEAYFPAVGWVAFDPTPGRSLPYAGASSSSPGFEDPFASSPSGSTTVTTEASPDRFPDRPGAAGTRQDEDDPGRGGGRVLWLLWVAGLAVLLAAWPFARRLWRERGLRRGTLTQRFAASLRLLRGALASYGMVTSPACTFEEMLDLVREHLGLSCDPVLAARAGAILFGGRRARPEDVERAETFRREAEAGLRRRHGLVKSLLVSYGVPPVKRRGALIPHHSTHQSFL